MSDSPLEGQGQEGIETQGPEDMSSGTGHNPAWDSLLEAIPSQLQPMVTPHLQTWDKNYQDGIAKVHSQYEGWKPFADRGVEPEQVDYALQVMQAIEERPEEVYRALLEAYPNLVTPATTPENQPQAPNTIGQQGQTADTFDITQHPQFQELEKMVNLLAQNTVQQRNSETEAQQDRELEAEVTRLTESKGEFDETWVFSRMLANDLTMEQAVDQYKAFEQGILTRQNQPAPRVIGAGGGVPTLELNPAKLDDKGRRELVMQRLQQAAQQNG